MDWGRGWENRRPVRVYCHSPRDRTEGLTSTGNEE